MTAEHSPKPENSVAGAALLPAASLEDALARRGLVLADDQAALVAKYAGLLWHWNEQLNLTRHTTWDRFVGRDLVDSLALAQCLAQGERVLDVGTGGGVPGVLLAIVRSDLHVVLLDSVGKKARAVEAMVAALGLNAGVYCDAVQKHLAGHAYDTLVVRAVARLGKLLSWLGPQRGQFQRALVIKGPAWIEERKEARHRGLLQGWSLRRLASYPLEGTDSQSVVLELRGGDARPDSAAECDE